MVIYTEWIHRRQRSSGYPWQSRFGSGHRIRAATLATAAEVGRNHVDATRIRLQDGGAVDAGALASRGRQQLSSDDDGGLSDSDP